jgi:hypothetical protein
MGRAFTPHLCPEEAIVMVKPEEIQYMMFIKRRGGSRSFLETMTRTGPFRIEGQRRANLIGTGMEALL